MNYADVQVIYRDVDRETLTVPKSTDPEIAKAIFLEAVKNMQEDYR